ncbi:DUF808 domain-containing protein [Brevibacterium jeotgali]|uniref:Inner membrane protein YedI n=1 Tax=Brevibacterium jeotgali TaxID=1262550 RepID=A0A2H1L1F9_9MICO|nr:DUF808 domain-containing protein [Brevibacterium jeotgali]TWC01980.1 hypothetical protein FB108_0642 [Brevibacterium jeotgali]SMY10669.1 hypothetical protein BJEO58_00240 [Brevibacterium jeotgali]
MSGGLVALLDDVAAMARLAAASVDDVAAGAAKAGAKAAGVVIDDAAVTPQYVTGVKPARELPMIWRITKGSLRNKLLIIVPILLVLSTFLPQVLTPLLMLGGAYLSYEGAHKVWEKLRGKHAERDEEPTQVKGRAAEDTVVRGAITTDFILSCEIMVISLNEVGAETLLTRAIILVVVAIGITALVYGAVAIIVKMDDVGLAMTQRPRAAAQRVGRALVTAMPHVLDGLAIVGTFAMLWVGGHILLVGMSDLGLSLPYDLVHSLETPVAGIAAVGGLLAWLVNTLCSMVLGFIAGSLVLGVISLTPLGTKGH